MLLLFHFRLRQPLTLTHTLALFDPHTLVHTHAQTGAHTIAILSHGRTLTLSFFLSLSLSLSLSHSRASSIFINKKCRS